MWGSATVPDVPDVEIWDDVRHAGVRTKFYLTELRAADDAIEAAEIDIWNAGNPDIGARVIDMATMAVDNWRDDGETSDLFESQFKKDREKFKEWKVGRKEADKWYPGKNIEKRLAETEDAFDMPYLEDYDFGDTIDMESDLLSMEQDIQLDMDENFNIDYLTGGDIDDLDIEFDEKDFLDLKKLSSNIGTEQFNFISNLLADAGLEGLLPREGVNLMDTSMYDFIVNQNGDWESWLEIMKDQDFDNPVDQFLKDYFSDELKEVIAQGRVTEPYEI